MPLRPATLLIILFAMVSVCQAETIRLRAKALVTGNVVHLGDIATVTAIDTETQWKLEDIEVAPAPEPGSQDHLGVDQIQRRVAAHGFTTATVDYVGSRLVTVERRKSRDDSPVRRASTESGDKEKAEAKTAVYRRSFPQSRQRRQAEDIVRAVVGDYLAKHAPEWGRPRIEPTLFEADIEPINLAGHQLVIQSGIQLRKDVFQLALTDEPGLPVQPIVSVRVSIHRRPLVIGARHDIPAGHIIHGSDLEIIEVDDQREGITSAESLIGMKAKRNIAAGQPVVAELVEKAMLVKNGDTVSVSVGIRGIRLSKQFKAIESGAMGDAITVQDFEDRDVKLSVMVTGPRTAQVVSDQTSATLR